MLSSPGLADLKKAYRDNQNIMGLFRAALGQSTNDPLAILTSYDLQAGSYVAVLHDAALAALHKEYTAAIARILDRLRPTSLLEAGVGEATTLLGVVQQLKHGADMPILGFDLSWSRIHVGRRYWNARQDGPAQLFVGELEAIPLPDASVDVVFTSHAIEPNHGRERVILRELGRVAGRYLVLCEPGYEFANPQAKRYMESHGYCRGLRPAAEEAGWHVREHRLLETCKNPKNPTAVLVLEKMPETTTTGPLHYVCPVCRTTLVLSEGAFFCEQDGLAFPILRGIPCLSRRNGLIASHFLDV